MVRCPLSCMLLTSAYRSSFFFQGSAGGKRTFRPSCRRSTRTSLAQTSRSGSCRRLSSSRPTSPSLATTLCAFPFSPFFPHLCT